jgi:hypothetical protein
MAQTAAAGGSSASSSVGGPAEHSRFGLSDLADTLETEEEMERAAMALSLAEARERAARAAGGAGSSSSHPSSSRYDQYTPATVTALLDMGFSEERVLEAYLNTDHGSLHDMMRYMSHQLRMSKRSRAPVAGVRTEEHGEAHDAARGRAPASVCIDTDDVGGMASESASVHDSSGAGAVSQRASEQANYASKDASSDESGRSTDFELAPDPRSSRNVRADRDACP